VKKVFPSFIKIGLSLIWAHRRLEFPGPDIFDTRFQEGGMWRLVTEQLRDEAGLPEIPLRIRVVVNTLAFAIVYLFASFLFWGLGKLIL